MGSRALIRTLARNYSIANLAGKSTNKKALQQLLGLADDPEIPLFGAVSRITYQKGYDLLLQVAKELTEIPAQLAVLGSGEAILERELSTLAKNHPGKIAVHIGFDEKLAHLIEAGADSFLMPSRFEPCGLNQMYSQRYGTPPLVHATGGLVDTVVDCTPATMASGSASGFLFGDMTPESFLGAIRRVATVYHDKRIWRRLKKNGMTPGFQLALQRRRLPQNLSFAAILTSPVFHGTACIFGRVFKAIPSCPFQMDA